MYTDIEVLSEDQEARLSKCLKYIHVIFPWYSDRIVIHANNYVKAK